MTPIDKLIEADRQTPKRIAIAGDAMEDHYIHGTLGACQEDAMRFDGTSHVVVDGGSANAARQLENWNCKTTLLCQHRHIQPIKSRFLVNGKFVFRYDVDEMECESVLSDRRKTEYAKLVSGKPDAVLISDYSKGFLTPDFIQQIIHYANERGIPVVADAKREPIAYTGTILKCNSDYVSRYQENLKRHGGHGVITREGRSPIVMNYTRQNWLVTSHDGSAIRCRNHVGSGDCFAATLTLALAHGLSLEEAATIAHSAGRVYVQWEHSRPPWPHEIKADLDPLAGKILIGPDMPALRKSVSGSIVFTNGCFDLLSVHHLYCLEQSKKHGDVLVVGVNSDESVRRLKGPKRPVQSLESRMAMLCGLSLVDWVVPYDDDTPSEIMRLLQPDVRTKGDFPELNRAGDEYAKEVRLIPPMTGHSTTATLRRITDSQ